MLGAFCVGKAFFVMNDRIMCVKGKLRQESNRPAKKHILTKTRAALAFAALLALTACAVLVGCAPTGGTDSSLDYQEKIAEIEGVWHEGDGEWGFAAQLDGCDMRLTLRSPESVEGVALRCSGAAVFMGFDGVEIPLEARNSDTVLRLRRLLSLDKADIDAFDKAGGDSTVLHGSGDGYEWTVTLNGAGDPTKIEYTDSNGSSSLEIESVKYAEHEG